MRGALNIFTSAAATALIFASFTIADDSVIVIEDFGDTHDMPWYSVSDGGFGGKSTADVFIRDGKGEFSGKVFTNPGNGSPGFIIMEAMDNSIPDISTCEGIRIRARSDLPYEGFSLSFGRRNMSMRGHIAKFEVGTAMETVDISFAKFNDYWKKSSGDELYECSRTNPQYCPSTNALANIGHISIWAEDVGEVKMQVESIKAYDCSEKTDGDLFKTIVNIFQEKPNEGGEGTSGDSTKDEEEKITDIENRIALPVAGAALFVALLALFGVWRMNRKADSNGNSSAQASAPELEKKPGDELL